MKDGINSYQAWPLGTWKCFLHVLFQNSQYGHCKVEYSVNNQSNGMVAVRKFLDFPSCKDFPVRSFRNVQRMVCPSGEPQVQAQSLSSHPVPKLLQIKSSCFLQVWNMVLYSDVIAYCTGISMYSTQNIWG
jgi:hypothetical protein